jgi:hypothetical protein
VLWELDQLDRDGRRDRVTVVFDDEAIENKALHTTMQEWAQQEYRDQVLWSGAADSAPRDAETLRARLSDRFVVVTPDEFEQDIERHRERIVASHAPLGPGEREMWVDFHFEPAIAADTRKRLDDFSAYVDDHTVRMIDGQAIDCLPLFLNLIQLRIFTALATGEHHAAGVSLTRYTAVIDVALRYYVEPDDRPGQLSEEKRKPPRDARGPSPPRRIDGLVHAFLRPEPRVR